MLDLGRQPRARAVLSGRLDAAYEAPVAGGGPVGLGPIELDVRPEGPRLTWAVANRGDTPVGVRSVQLRFGLPAASPVKVFCHGYQSWSRSGTLVLGSADDPSHTCGVEWLRGMWHADASVSSPGELRSELVAVLDTGTGEALYGFGFEGATEHDGTFRFAAGEDPAEHTAERTVEVTVEAFLGDAVLVPGETRTLHAVSVSRGDDASVLLEEWAAGFGARNERACRRAIPDRLVLLVPLLQRGHRGRRARQSRARGGVAVRGVPGRRRLPVGDRRLADHERHVPVGDGRHRAGDPYGRPDARALVGSVPCRSRLGHRNRAPGLARPLRGRRRTPARPDEPAVGRRRLGARHHGTRRPRASRARRRRARRIGLPLPEARLPLLGVAPGGVRRPEPHSGATCPRRPRGGPQGSRCRHLPARVRLPPGPGGRHRRRDADRPRRGTVLEPRLALPGYDLEAPSTRNAYLATLTRSFQHRRLWLNDPDCVMLRTSHTQLDAGAARTWAETVALSGGMLLVSDDLALLDAGARTLLEEAERIGRRSDAQAQAGPPARCLDLTDTAMPTRFAAAGSTLVTDPADTTSVLTPREATNG